MALYEVVLQKPSGDEVRFTDRRPAIGDRFVIGNRDWTVVLERDPSDIRATARFLCELTREQRGRALAAQTQDRMMRERMRRLKARQHKRPPSRDSA